MSDKKPEALRLAAWLNEGAWRSIRLIDVEAAGRELRRQHAVIDGLVAALTHIHGVALAGEWRDLPGIAKTSEEAIAKATGEQK